MSNGSSVNPFLMEVVRQAPPPPPSLSRRALEAIPQPVQTVVGRAVSPILTGLEYYDRFVLNPLQRAFLAAMEKTLGFEASQRERSIGTDIDLIQAWREAAPNWPKTAFTFGLLSEIAVDPLTYLSFSLKSAGKATLQEVVPRVTRALAEAQVPLQRQTARTVLATLEAAADPNLLSRVSPDIARAAVAVRNQLGGTREGQALLANAIREGRQGFANLNRVIDETASILRRQGITEAEIRRRLAAAPEVVRARAQAAAPLLRRATSATPLEQAPSARPVGLISTALGQVEGRLATTTAERVRAGLAGPGLRIPFTDIATPIFPREAAARVAETGGVIRRSLGRLVPEQAAQRFRSLFVPLSRRSPDFEEILAASQATEASSLFALRRQAQAILSEAERLGAKTNEEAARLIFRAARGEAVSRGELRLLSALNRYNSARLALERTAGFQEKAFATGRALGQEAERLRGVGATVRATVQGIPAIERAEDIRPIAQRFTEAFVKATTTVRPFPELRLSGASLRAIRRTSSLAERELSRIADELEVVARKRQAALAALEKIPTGETVRVRGARLIETAGPQLVLPGFIPTRIAEVEQLVREARALASRGGRVAQRLADTAQEAQAAFVRIVLRGAPEVPTAIGRQAILRDTAGEVRRLAQTLARLEDLASGLGRTGQIPAEIADRMKALVRAIRDRVLASRSDIRAMISQARAIKARELRRARIETQVRRLEKEAAELLESAKKVANDAAKRILVSQEFIGKVAINAKALAVRMALETNLVRGTPSFNAFVKAAENQIAGALRHLKLQETRGRFFADIGRRAAIIGRVPLQLALPAEARGARTLRPLQEGAAALYRVPPSVARTIRTATADIANAIYRGEIGLEEFIVSVGTRAPHEAGQAVKDFLTIRLSAMEVAGNYNNFMLMATNSDAAKAAEVMASLKPELRQLFSEDPVSIFARDIRLAAGRIADSQTMLRSVSMFARLPPIDGDAKIGRAEWGRMLQAAGGKEQAAGLILPKDVRAVTREFLSPQQVQQLVRVVTNAEEPVVRAGETLHIVDRAVAQEIARTARFFGDRDTMGPILATLDTINNLWRRAVTIGIGIPVPAFNIRNTISDTYMGLMAGASVSSPSYHRSFALAFVSRFKEKEYFRPMLSETWVESRLTGFNYSGFEVLELASYHGLIGRGAGVMSGILSQNAEIFRTALARRRPVDKAKAIANFLPETVADIMASQTRLWIFMDGLEKGLDPLRAAMRTKAILYDYSQLTRFERQALRQFVPFYAWLRLNIPRTFKALIHEPRTVLTPFRASQVTIDDYRGQIPAALTRQLPIIISSTPDSIKVMTQKAFLPTADIDQFLRLFTEPSQASREILAENFGGVFAVGVQRLTNVNLFRTAISGRLVPLERFPLELERYDMFGIRLPSSVAPVIPRPLSDFERVLRDPNVSPLRLLGIPVREIERDRLDREIVGELTEVKTNLASAMRRAISRNDIKSITDIAARLRRVDADILATKDKKDRPRAWRSWDHMVEVLADPRLEPSTRETVLAEMARDLSPRDMARLRAALTRRLQRDEREEGRR